jgi:DNA-binding winged helix-turn-helix (wHTH) protein/pimeloyl-ACP methyl ester carboxylesterase
MGTMDNRNPQRLRFDSYVLDMATAELRHSDEVVPVEPQTFDLIAYLARNAGRIVSKDELIAMVWQGRTVSDSTISSQISAARHALNDSGKLQRVVKTVHGRGFRFNATVKAEGPSCGPAKVSTVEATSVDIRYCRSPDGVGLAYASTGSGPPLVRAASFLTHLEYDLQSVLFSHWINDLSREFRYLRYDERGNGLSDWNTDDFSFEKMIVDLETVVEATGLEQFALLGSSQGASVSIAFAHRHPDKISCLVIYDGFATGFEQSEDQDFKETRRALLELTRVSWGKPNPVGRQAYASLFMPNATTDQQADFNKLQQVTTTPENAHKILKAFSEIDVRPLLPEIRVPTLVLHRRDDAVVPFEAGRLIASSIPHAKFVPLDGANHIVLEHEPEWQKILIEVTKFVHHHSTEMPKS